jgi:transcriptional regulator with XRE-family HTH domain
MSDQLAEAVRKALTGLPGSDRALAIEAGVSQATIWRIRHGERGVSDDVVEAIADALERWGDRCGVAEQLLREALEAEQEGGTT